MKKSVLLLSFSLFVLAFIYAFSFKSEISNNDDGGQHSLSYAKAKVNYDSFKQLVDEVEKHRKSRLVSLDTFLSMSKRNNVIILDSRSANRYERKHIKGAKHLAFTDFTQENLNRLFKDKNTTILIYCNNNFQGDEIDFASKVALPVKKTSSSAKPEEGLTLALNIPTYINLYGYGFRNVYELDELVDVSDKRIKFEGSEVIGSK